MVPGKRSRVAPSLREPAVPRRSGGTAAAQLACLVAVCALVAGCQSPAVDEDGTENGYARVATEAELASLYGRRLELNPGEFLVVDADGTFGGSFGGNAIDGTWEMRDGYWCRTLEGSEDCQLWRSDGARVRGTRDRGEGNSFVYTIR